MSQYLSGDFEPKQKRLSSISKALNVSETWLLGYDVPMDRDENIPTDETMNLTNSEKMLVKLFRCVPDDKREFALQMIRLAAGKQE